MTEIGMDFGNGRYSGGWQSGTALLEMHQCRYLTQRGNPKFISKKYTVKGISPGRGEIQKEKSRDPFCH